MFMDMMYSLRNVFIYFSFLISLPSALLYSSQIVVILRHRQFHNAFYALFVARAIVDLFLLANSLYGYRLPCLFGQWLEPFYTQLPGWCLALYFFLTYYTFHAENLAVDLILLNRLSAIAVPMLHEKLWRLFTPMGLFIIFLLPVCFSFFLFGMDAQVLVMTNDPASGNGTSLLLYEKTTNYLNSNSIVCCISALLFLLISLLINLAIYLVYKRRQRALAKAQQGHGQKAKHSVVSLIETRLLVYAITSFIGHLLPTLFLIGVYVCVLTGDLLAMAVLFSQAPWIADLGSIVIPSWMLLWASTNFRQQWAKDCVPRLLLLVWGRLARRGKGTVPVTKVVNVNVLVPSNQLGANSVSRRPTVTIVNNYMGDDNHRSSFP